MKITYKKGVCSNCSEEKTIVHKSKKLCLYCLNGLKSQKTAKAFCVKRFPIKKKFKASGELEIFKQIWAERPHVSQVSGEVLNEFNILCFSHILTKQAYPKFKLYKDNIWLVTPAEHIDWEAGRRSDPKWEAKKTKANELIEEYYQGRKLA